MIHELITVEKHNVINDDVIIYKGHVCETGESLFILMLCLHVQTYIKRS